MINLINKANSNGYLMKNVWINDIKKVKGPKKHLWQRVFEKAELEIQDTITWGNYLDCSRELWISLNQCWIANQNSRRSQRLLQKINLGSKWICFTCSGNLTTSPLFWWYPVSLVPTCLIYTPICIKRIFFNTNTVRYVYQE